MVDVAYVSITMIQRLIALRKSKLNLMSNGSSYHSFLLGPRLFSLLAVIVANLGVSSILSPNFGQVCIASQKVRDLDDASRCPMNDFITETWARSLTMTVLENRSSLVNRPEISG